jgi:hypothetical protein
MTPDLSILAIALTGIAITVFTLAVTLLVDLPCTPKEQA